MAFGLAGSLLKWGATKAVPKLASYVPKAVSALKTFGQTKAGKALNTGGNILSNIGLGITGGVGIASYLSMDDPRNKGGGFTPVPEGYYDAVNLPQNTGGGVTVKRGGTGGGGSSQKPSAGSALQSLLTVPQTSADIDTSFLSLDDLSMITNGEPIQGLSIVDRIIKSRPKEDIKDPQIKYDAGMTMREDTTGTR